MSLRVPALPDVSEEGGSLWGGSFDGWRLFFPIWRLTVKFQSFWRLTVIKVARLEFLGGYLPRLSINYVGYGKKVTTTVLYKDENFGGIPPKKSSRATLGQEFE